MKATPKEHITYPPSSAVSWFYRHRADVTVFYVVAKTWFDARSKAMCALGCGPGDVEVWINPMERPCIR